MAWRLRSRAPNAGHIPSTFFKQTVPSVAYVLQLCTPSSPFSPFPVLNALFQGGDFSKEGLYDLKPVAHEKCKSQLLLFPRLIV